MKKKPVVPTSFRMKLGVYDLFERFMAETNTSRNEALNYMLRLGLDTHYKGRPAPYDIEKGEEIKGYVYDGPPIPAKLEDDTGSPPPNFDNTTSGDQPETISDGTTDEPRKNSLSLGLEDDLVL